MVVRWLLCVCVMGVVVGVSEGTGVVGVDRCKSSCSAVPEDLWPYCCESHNTCCEEFANSCMHDCLPRVHTGDVSVVEERPGLCCALYNLCCFRETFRMSSHNPNIPATSSFPLVHRFHTGPPPAQKPVVASSSVAIPRGRPQSNRRDNGGEIKRMQEPGEKRTNLFRSEPRKKLRRTDSPQALTKPDEAEGRNRSPVKPLVRDIQQELSKVPADDGRRETLIEIKNPKSRPKTPSPLASRTDGETLRGEPSESLGPRRPANQFASVSDDSNPSRSLRPRVSKRLRFPTSEGRVVIRTNGDKRIRPAGRQRPPAGRPSGQSSTRQRPQEQTGRQRPGQQEGRKTQTGESRRTGRPQTSSATTTKVDRAPETRVKTQARPQKVRPVQEPVVVQVEAVQIMVPDLPEIEVDLFSVQKPAVVVEGKEDKMTDKMESVGEGMEKTEMEMMDKGMDDMAKMEAADGQMPDKIEESADMTKIMASEIEMPETPSEAGMEETKSPEQMAVDQVIIQAVEDMMKQETPEATIQPSRGQAEAKPQAGGRTKTSRSEDSQAPEATSTRGSRTRSGSRGTGGREEGSRGRPQAEEGTGSRGGQGRTRSGGRGRAQETEAEAGDITQGRQSSRGGRRSSRQQ